MYIVSHSGSCNWSVRVRQLTRKVLKKSVKTDFLRFWEMVDWEVPRPDRKLKNDYKVRILSWKEDRISLVEIAKWLGWHRASIERLWAKSKTFRNLSFQSIKWVLADPKRLPW
jgi:hypothetical protein